MARSKRKPKLHPIVAAMGYSNEADFYADFPTQESYEMAMGGYLPKAQMYNSVVKSTLTPVDRPGFSGIYNASDSTPSDVSFALPENLGTPMVTPRDKKDNVPTTSDTTGYQYQWQDPTIQQNMAIRRGFSEAADWFASGKDKDIISKMRSYNAANPPATDSPSTTLAFKPVVRKDGGFVENFPYIQTEQQFFSPGFYNTYNPNNTSSLKMGGFPKAFGKPFATQPTAGEFFDYGYSNTPLFIAERGGAPCYKCGGGLPKAQFAGSSPYKAIQLESPRDIGSPTPFQKYLLENKNTFGTDTIPAGFWFSPKDPANDAALAKAIGETYGHGVGNILNNEKNFINIEDYYGRNSWLLNQDAVDQRGWSDTWGKPIPPERLINPEKYGWYKHGPYEKGGPADFNMGSNYYSNKLKQFNQGLQDTGYDTIQSQIGYHMMPDNSVMADADHPGYLEQAKDGKWIQKATKSIKRRGTEGVCTGSKFGGPSCPPGSKRYNLAKTFRKMAKNRKKQDGGQMDEQTAQIYETIASALEQGQDPNQILQALVEQGVPQEQAEQLIQQVAEQSQSMAQEGADEYFKYGGYKLPKAQSGWQCTTQGCFPTSPFPQYDVQGVTVKNPDGTYSSIDPSLLPSMTQNNEYDKLRYLQQLMNQGRSFQRNSILDYMPAYFEPFIKIKNPKFYFNGVPQSAGSSPFISGSSATQGIGNDFWANVTTLPKKYHYQIGTGARPSNVGDINPFGQRRGSWLGNKLRQGISDFKANMEANKDYYGVNFPSKAKRLRIDQERYEDLQEMQDRLEEAEQAQRERRQEIYDQNDYNEPTLYTDRSKLMSIDPSYLPHQPYSGPDAYPGSPNFWVNPDYVDPNYDPNNIPEEYSRDMDIQNKRQYGGSYVEGQELDLSDEEIQKLIDGGYQIEYLD